MAGIYIHLPFCKQACHYCDFHFSTSLKLKSNLLTALALEISVRKSELKGKEIGTIYFGGGTPSLMSASELKLILSRIFELFPVEKNAEITLEANPDDLTLEKLSQLKEIGINRLSVGIQSFNDDSLTWMNRAHNSNEAKSSLLDAKSVGFDNISVDLIYGLPGLTIQDWRNELEEIFSFEIQHLSAYCLTVESKTPLGKWVQSGKERPVDEEAANQQFTELVSSSAKANLIQYEVSNFGLPGYFSRHNTSYWKGIPYLGIGPSAHSYLGSNRSWNVANNAQYIKGVHANKPLRTIETLENEDQINELIMTGLRTIWGVNLEDLKSKFGYDLMQKNQAKIDELIKNNLAKLDQSHLQLTKKGLFFADGIASDFFILRHEN